MEPEMLERRRELEELCDRKQKPRGLGEEDLRLRNVFPRGSCLTPRNNCADAWTP